MAYADYSYYTTQFSGSAISEEDFPGLAARASAAVDYYTLGQAARAAGSNREAVQNAVCALAEIFQDEARLSAQTFSSDRAAQVRSETVGGWNRQFGSAAVTGADLELMSSRKREAAAIYLGPAGLLEAVGYRGCSR